MSQIQTKILKQGTQTREVLTCCFFTMEDAYRSFKQYESNLKHFLKQSKHLQTFEIRIYTDDTGKDIALDVSKNDHRVTVIHFDCPAFREERGHIGTFGTIVRFLPLFEDLNTVWSSDIDIPDSYLDAKLVDTTSDFVINTVACYDLKVWGRKYTILGGRFISKIKFPKILLTRFLTKLSSGNLSSKIEEINTANKRKKESRIPYGIDELFLNTVIYNYLQTHSNNIAVHKDYSADTFIRWYVPEKDAIILEKFYRNPTIANFNKVKQVYISNSDVLLKRFPCLEGTYHHLNSFKNNFMKTNIVSGSEL